MHRGLHLEFPRGAARMSRLLEAAIVLVLLSWWRRWRSRCSFNLRLLRLFPVLLLPFYHHRCPGLPAAIRCTPRRREGLRRRRRPAGAGVSRWCALRLMDGGCRRRLLRLCSRVHLRVGRLAVSSLPLRWRAWVRLSWGLGCFCLTVVLRIHFRCPGLPAAIRCTPRRREGLRRRRRPAGAGVSRCRLRWLLFRGLRRGLLLFSTRAHHRAGWTVSRWFRRQLLVRLRLP